MTGAESELILDDQRRVYHLRLAPAQAFDRCICVGDPARVPRVSRHFDRVTERVEHREFITHIGELNGARLACMSTGMGTDNVDIALNELDALLNVDFQTRRARSKLRSMRLLRLGTAGGLQKDVALGSWVFSARALGLDGLGPAYDWSVDTDMARALQAYPRMQSMAYSARADQDMLDSALSYLQGVGTQQGALLGATLTAAGFYTPQGRSIRLTANADTSLHLAKAELDAGLRFENMEMETAGLYGLARALGHRALSVSVLLANRVTGAFASDPSAAVERMIEALVPWFACLGDELP